MAWFRNLRVMSKLLLTALVALSLLITVGALSYVTMQRMGRAAESMYRDRTVPLSKLVRLYEEAYTVQMTVLKHTIAPTGDDKDMLVRDIQRREQGIDVLLTEFEASELLDEERDALNHFREVWDRYVAARQTPLQASATGNEEFARQLAYSGVAGHAFIDASMALSQLADVNTRVAGDLNERIQAESEQSLTLNSMLLAIAVIGSAGATIGVARGLSRPLAAVARAAGQMADGDLTLAEMTYRSGDEVGQLAQAFNRMMRNVRSVVEGVSASTRQVLTASGELSTAAEQSLEGAREVAEVVNQVASGAGEQAESATEVRRTMEQLQETIRQIAAGSQQGAAEVQSASERLGLMVRSIADVARNAEMVTQSAMQAAETARSGADVVSGSVAGMERIRHVVRESAERIDDLEQISAQIDEITQVIAAIAEQTNLLALNAAIEAARAGEHGRGFAVVADEVRKLAERSAVSTEEIKKLVATIHDRTQRAVASMGAGISEVEQGSALAQNAGAALQEILSMVERAAEGVREISQDAASLRATAGEVASAFDAVAALSEENTAATEEMAAGAEQVAHAMERVAVVAAENAAAAEEVSAGVHELHGSANAVAASSHSLTAVSQELQRQVVRFRI